MILVHVAEGDNIGPPHFAVFSTSVSPRLPFTPMQATLIFVVGAKDMADKGEGDGGGAQGAGVDKLAAGQGACSRSFFKGANAFHMISDS